MNIIDEEMSEFFGDKNNAETTLRNIQNRASLYVSEKN